MTDSKDNKTTITLEPGQVAAVLGMEDGQISRQLFASPESTPRLTTITPTSRSTTSGPRLSWYAWIRRRISPPTWPSGTMKSFSGRQAGQPQENEARPIAFPALHCLACPKNKPPRQERLEEPALS